MMRTSALSFHFSKEIKVIKDNDEFSRVQFCAWRISEVTDGRVAET